jgi:hypothetical protein
MYEILKADDIWGLMREVRKLRAKGWRCAGGVAIKSAKGGILNTDETTYYQAMEK